MAQKKKILFKSKEIIATISNLMAVNAITSQGGSREIAELAGTFVEKTIKAFEVRETLVTKLEISIEDAVWETMDSEGFEIPNECVSRLAEELFKDENLLAYLETEECYEILQKKIRSICNEYEECDPETLPVEIIAEKIIVNLEKNILANHELTGQQTLRSVKALSEEIMNNQELLKEIRDLLRKENQEKQELTQFITEANEVLGKNQNKMRVYSWDELEFKPLYVIPSMREEYTPYLFLSGLPGNGKSTYIPSYFAKMLEFTMNEQNNTEWRSVFKENEEKPQIPQSLSERVAKVSNLFKYSNIVYVVGGAGYGKSLFLTNLCVNPQILKDFEKNPLLIIRGDIKRMIREDGSLRSMMEFLESCFTEESLKNSEEVCKDFLKRCLEEGRCLILLDALDEVGSDKRDKLHNLIVEYFEKTYPDNKVCITSRDRGFIPREHINCYHIEPIMIEEVEEYVDHFIELHKFDASAKTDFVNKASILIEKDFVKGFLTLSLLMAIYRAEQDLPTSKYLLYEKCFDYIATTREKLKDPQKDSDNGKGYEWSWLLKLMTDASFMELARLGLPNNSDISKEKIVELLLGLFERRFESSLECKMAIETFLKFCADRTKVFVPSPVSNMEYRFFHRSFYEYFYAKYIESRTRTVEETYEELKRFDVDSEVFELLVTIYERRNPMYLEDLMDYLFEMTGKKNTVSEGECCMKVLVMILQVIDHTKSIQRFIDLVLEKGDDVSACSGTLSFGLFSNIFMRQPDYLKQKMKEHEQLLSKTIPSRLLKNIVINHKAYVEAEPWTLRGYDAEAVNRSQGFTYPRLLIFMENKEDYMKKCFEKFRNRTHLIGVEKLQHKEVAAVLHFAETMKDYKEEDKIRLLYWMLRQDF